MEDAKRRRALCQSSAGSFWSYLTLTQEQPGQSPDTEAGSVQSRAATHRAAVRLCAWGVLGFSWVALVWCGWDGTPGSHSWEQVQALWAVLSCVWGVLGDQLYTDKAVEWCSHIDPVAPLSKQEDSWEVQAPFLGPSTQHSNCSADRPGQADLTGSTLLSLLRKENKVSWCIKCHLMDTGEEGILHLGANINTAWCLTMWRVIPKEFCS